LTAMGLGVSSPFTGKFQHLTEFIRNLAIKTL
jgi:hypothetical protein